MKFHKGQMVRIVSPLTHFLHEGEQGIIEDISVEREMGVEIPCYFLGEALCDHLHGCWYNEAELTAEKSNEQKN